ncbi:MAG: hypothetical protein U0350_30305 [Caldilineaceae bacterium]
MPILAEPLPVQVKNLEDLKQAMAAPTWFDTLQAQATWLPDLVASLPWQTKLSEHILLHYYIDVQDETDACFASLVNEMEQIYGELHAFFQITAKTKQEQLLVQTRLIFFFIKTHTGRVFGSLTDPHLILYFWDTKHQPDYLQKIRHEMAHWVWSRLYGEAPALFQEGVAILAEERSSPKAKVSFFVADCPRTIDEIPPLTDLAFNENFWRHKTPYGVGGQLVDYLVQRWGWSPLKRLFLLSAYEDVAILTHFAQIYGQSLNIIDAEWRTFLKQKRLWDN